MFCTGKLFQTFITMVVVGGGVVGWHAWTKYNCEPKNFTIAYAYNTTVINDFQYDEKYECKVVDVSDWETCEISSLNTSDKDKWTINKDIKTSLEKSKNLFQIKIHKTINNMQESTKIVAKTKKNKYLKHQTTISFKTIFDIQYQNKKAKEIETTTNNLLYKSNVDKSLLAGSWEMKNSDGSYNKVMVTLLPLSAKELYINQDFNFGIMDTPSYSISKITLTKNVYYWIKVKTKCNMKDLCELRWTSTKKTDQHNSFIIKAKPVVYSSNISKIFVINN